MTDSEARGLIVTGKAPEGLQVGGGLYLSGTQITALPEGLQVGGGLYLRGTQITIASRLNTKLDGSVSAWYTRSEATSNKRSRQMLSRMLQLAVLILAASLASAETRVYVSQSTGHIVVDNTAVNKDVLAIQADMGGWLFVKDEPDFSVGVLVPANGWQEFLSSRPAGKIKVLSVYYTDGSVAGTEWAAQYATLHQDFFAGRTMHASPASSEERGDSWMFAEAWARRYAHDHHGVKPQIVYDRPGGPAAPRGNIHPNLVSCSSIIESTWSTTCYVNGVPDPHNTNVYACSEEISVPLSGAYTSLAGTGSGGCTQPNYYMPGKTVVQISFTAFSSCPTAVLDTYYEQQISPPPPAYACYMPASYQVAYADAKVILPGNLTLEGYEIDSCIASPVVSPLQVTTHCQPGGGCGFAIRPKRGDQDIKPACGTPPPNSCIASRPH